jgi:hypothetical protein
VILEQGEMENQSAQKIIIPRGLIDPSETTIIEIPQHLKRTPVIVAQKQTRWAQQPQETNDDYYHKRKTYSTKKMK